MQRAGLDFILDNIVPFCSQLLHREVLNSGNNLLMQESSYGRMRAQAVNGESGIARL